MRTIVGLRVFWGLIVAALLIAGLEEPTNGLASRMVGEETPATAEARFRLLSTDRWSLGSRAATIRTSPLTGAGKSR